MLDLSSAKPHSTNSTIDDCWNRIGVRGDYRLTAQAVSSTGVRQRSWDEEYSRILRATISWLICCVPS